jgi:hypothetical protein
MRPPVRIASSSKEALYPVILISLYNSIDIQRPKAVMNILLDKRNLVGYSITHDKIFSP